MSLRALGRTCIALFALSTVFPIVAAVLNVGRPLRALGVADVIVAAGLIGSTALLVVRARRAVTDAHRLMAGRATQGVIGVIPLLLAAYFLLGRRLDWTVLVIGLAWRGWLLLHSLPALAAALSAPRPPSAGAGRPAVDG